jgi:hypothetical protein
LRAETWRLEVSPGGEVGGEAACGVVKQRGGNVALRGEHAVAEKGEVGVGVADVYAEKPAPGRAGMTNVK